MLKSFFKIGLTAMLATVLVACGNKATEPQPYLQLKDAGGAAVQSVIKAGKGASSQTLIVKAVGAWEVKNSTEWLLVSPTSGKDDGSFRIDIQKNTGEEARTARLPVLLNGAEVTAIEIVQSGVGVRLTATASLTEKLPATGGAVTFTIDASSEWEYAISDGDWLTETARTDVILTVEAAATTARRTATITFSLKNAPSVTAQLTVEQAAPEAVQLPVADMLDVVFKNDGTAEDVSPMHHTVETLESTAMFTYYDRTYERYGARFTHSAGSSVTAGYYKIDYAGNTNFCNKLADGHTMEALFTFEDDMPKNTEIKVFSSMQSGGTGIMISSDNQLSFLPNISTNGASSWQWTKSGITPVRGTYYHIIGVWDKANGKNHVYVNGELAKTVSVSGNFVFPSATSCYWFGIGCDAGPSSGEAAWRGKALIARIYDAPLTTKDITNLYNAVRKDPPADEINLTNITFLSGINVLKGGVYNILATGFEDGDKIRLTALNNAANTALCSGAVSADRIQITLPSDLVTGRYRLTVERGASTLDLGFTTLNVVASIAPSNAQVIAHRGYWNIAGSAQNSMKALEEAQKLGVYGAEFDVWITSDGRVMLNHDASYNGVTIQNATYEQTKNLTLSNGEKMPTLDDYLEAGKKADTKLILEIKTHSTRDRNNAVVDECVRLVNASGIANKVEYIAFDLENCKRIVQKQPDAVVAYLNGDKTPAELNALGIKGIDYNISILQSHPEYVKQSHDLGMMVNIWTISSESDIIWAINLGVDYITTDAPALAKQLTDLYNN
ncbi:MAG: hypothetical protein LBR06_09220 [Bacteroidales bacterium]|nr:hypothetical protein [Bacteroidales bacterium]